MYGGEETSTPSSTVHPPIQQPPQEINVDEHLSSKNTSNKKKTQEPLPTIITTKWADSPTSADRSRSFSITTDSNKSKELESTSKADTLFGLSTIKENLDTNENVFNSKQQQDEEIDFDNYWNQIKKPPEPKKSKKPAPILQQPKEKKRSTLSQSDDIQTPSTSISVKINPISTSSTTTKQSDNTHDDSTDEDVDELLGKLEVRISGKYTHTYIHIYTHRHIYFSLHCLFNFCSLLYVCVRCIFLIRNFSYEKKPAGFHLAYVQHAFFCKT
jgi:hypothetical protein